MLHKTQKKIALTQQLSHTQQFVTVLQIKQFQSKNNRQSDNNQVNKLEMNPQDPVTENPEVDLIENQFNFGGNEIWPPYSDPTYVMPAEIEVNVEMMSGSYSFPVSIVKNTTKKPYFGGYQNTVNHKLYHHASTQTPTEKKQQQKEVSHLRTRETQTHDSKSVSVQPVREHGTQMQRIDLYLDNSRDVFLTPKTYFTSEELMYLKREKCVEIQRVWRGYMARCRAYRLHQSIVEQEEKVLQARSVLLSPLFFLLLHLHSSPPPPPQ